MATRSYQEHHNQIFDEEPESPLPSNLDLRLAEFRRERDEVLRAQVSKWEEKPRVFLLTSPHSLLKEEESDPIQTDRDFWTMYNWITNWAITSFGSKSTNNELEYNAMIRAAFDCSFQANTFSPEKEELWMWYYTGHGHSIPLQEVNLRWVPQENHARSDLIPSN
eukprot:TRINITY_DN15839_c0_g1_i1.p1 TRINITY_DN15839_c0_g1~~TRINITY_DN15839_c0_g1_i1.p1  ORF type:complete len:165 (+),score=28.86 TRINITY_DN15839_c0_g1_i1:64-558(+)